MLVGGSSKEENEMMDVAFQFVFEWLPRYCS